MRRRGASCLMPEGTRVTSAKTSGTEKQRGVQIHSGSSAKSSAVEAQVGASARQSLWGYCSAQVSAATSLSPSPSSLSVWGQPRCLVAGQQRSVSLTWVVQT